MQNRRIRAFGSKRITAFSAILATGVALWAFACSSGPRAVIHVDHQVALFDTPVAVTITGLRTNDVIVVRATTRDERGTVWSSFGTYTADANGDVDLRSASSGAGSYHGVDAMGLFWSMTPTNSAVTVYGFPTTGEVVALSVTDAGSLVGSTTVIRNELNPGVIGPRIATVSETGFYGVYDQPANVVTQRVAVLAFGGSEGGLSTATLAYALATHGYPTLAVAYFGEPGLPSSLSNIPLEYFARALDWLRAQPAVDPDHMIVFGVSRGSEAALLLGVQYPDLVHGVIAMVPSNVAICSVPGCGGPAWTLGNKPLPYTKELNNPAPDDVPTAAIPVEKIAGPVLLDCGGLDQVWASCAYADAIVGRLDRNGDLYPHTLLRYPDAGHGIGDPIPYAPISDPAQLEGAFPESNAQAREHAWPALLDFLAQQ